MVAYYSCTLSRPERYYCVTHKELLAVVKAIKHFHVYLYGRKFLLRTDHSALQWLLSFRHPEGQVARWLERLQQYDFTVEHRAGTKHGNADALSRRPCLLEVCKHCDRLDSLRTPPMMTKTELPECQSRSEQTSHEFLFPEGLFPLCQFPLRQFLFGQLPTLSIPILSIPIHLSR